VKAATRDWAGLNGNAGKKSRELANKLDKSVKELQMGLSCIAKQLMCKELKEQLLELQMREEMDLRQRAHIDWLRQGDQGTAFFGRAIRSRCSKNSIMRTLDLDGNQVTSLNEMKERLVNHFTGIYDCLSRPPPITSVIFEEQVSPELNV